MSKGNRLLVLVLDVNPSQRLFAQRPEAMTTWLDAVLAFGNAHLMLHPSNTLVAIAAHGNSCSFLYPDPEGGDDFEVRQRDGQYELFYQVETSIRNNVSKILQREFENGVISSEDSLLAGGLALALTFINRKLKELKLKEPRILVMSASGDTAAQYMNYMNAFFTAQKLDVCIDACMLDQDSPLLQQGSDITGGIYFNVTDLSALLQFLLWIFLPDVKLRSQLGLPTAAKVDYRAACFCHRQMVDIGFVCSVCLSIFCKFSPICTTCLTVFKTHGLALAAGRKKKDKSKQS